MSKFLEDNSVKNSPKRSEFVTKMHTELDNLEDLLLDTFAIFGRKIFNEEKAYLQIDRVRDAIPDAIAKAEDILAYEEKIVLDAQQRARQIILQAEEKANLLVDESKILRQVEIEANQIRQKNIQECEEVRSQALVEVNQMRQKYKQEQELVHKQEITDLQNMRQEVRDYSDSTLADLEKRLLEITRVVQGGRKHIQQELKPLK
jgi:cell division septum initiation protein DivIVA